MKNKEIEQEMILILINLMNANMIQKDFNLAMENNFNNTNETLNK